MILLQALQALLQLILKRIAHRGQDDILVGIESLAGGAGTAPAATDQADAQGVGVFFGKEFPGKIAGAASALPTRAEALRNSRRDVRLLDGVFMIQILTAIQT